MAGLRGRTFGGYQLVEQVAGGGIADVYRGRPTKSGGRDVIVKVIYPEFAHQPGFLPHFRQIVANSSKLASHPHILPLLASGEDSGYLYLVTPFVEAGTLRDWVRKGGRMGVGDAAPFFRQLCDALTYAHNLSVVHGNLKPSNIFLFEGRHVLVGDFGMLWDVSHMDMNHAGSGTEAVEFLAPEVLSGQVTQLSDIYSVGALLFAALTGHAPFQAATPAEVFAAASHQPVPHLAQANPALPAAAQTLDVVIQKAMAKRPEERFPSAAAVAQSIETSARQAQNAPAPAPAFSGGMGAPFVPMSGPIPFGSAPLPPQAGATAYSGMPGAMPASGMPFAAPDAAFPAPAISLAQAAAAIGNGAVPSLGQLDPPFPPLPNAVQSDAQMEQARLGGIGGGTGMQPSVRQSPADPLASQAFSDSTMRVPAPASAGQDVPLQPTMRVPAPGIAASLNDGSQPGAGGGSPLGSSGFDAPPEQRVVRISGAPRAKLGRLDAAPFPTLDDDDEEFAPPAMPAIRPPAGPGGFAVAGGNGSFDPGARGMSPPQNGAFSRDGAQGSAALDTGMGTLDSSLLGKDSYAGSSGGGSYDGRFGASNPHGANGYANSGMLDGASAEYAGFSESTAGQPWGGESREGYTGEYDSAQGGARWGEYTGEYGAGYTGEYTGAQAAPHYSGDLERHHPADVGADGRPFSATQLGLPRLTSPVLADQPPSWQDILSESGILPGGAASNMSNGRGGPGDHAPTWEDAGESMWQVAVQAPPRQEPQPRVPQHIEAEWAGTGVAGGWDAQAAQDGKRKKKDKRARQEEPEDSGFDDDRVWTIGTTAVRPRRRWPRKLALLLLVIILIDLGALLVLRPDLCPNQNCRALSSTLRHHLGLLQNTPAPTPAPFTVAPNPVTLTVAASKVANASLTVTNASGDSVTWKASAGLPWITLTPASGALAADGTATLTFTAKPTNIKAGTYTTTVTISLTGATPQTVTVPVTIHVTS